VNWRHYPIAICLSLLTLAPTAWGQSSPAPSSGAPAAAPKPTSGSGVPSDIDKVEKLLAARREYQGSLEQLRAHYLAVGDAERAQWASDELTQYHRMLKQAYRLELDVPPPTLQGLQNINEANELYRRALGFKQNSGLPFTSSYVDNQRRAELLFQQLLSNYPQSDKIDDTAYQLGEIYEGSAFKQYRRAAQYYERCFQWNPKTHLDARLKAARLYDRNLQERSRAIEIYRDIVTRETDPKRITEANKRLAELSTVKK
jgi:TolA-binding protein